MEVASARPPSVWESLVGVVFSPGELFTRVARAPRWAAILAVVTAVYAIAVGAFMATEVGQEAWLDQAVASAQSFGGQLNEQQLEGMEKMKPYVGYFAAGQMAVFIPLISLAVAGIAFAIFSAALGGTASFKQVFAIVAHAGALAASLQLFVWPLNYLRESMSSPTSLAVFLPTLDESSFFFRFLRAIDLLLVWWVVVLAIGLAVLYRRRTKPIALAFLAVYAVIALGIAAITKS